MTPQVLIARAFGRIVRSRQRKKANKPAAFVRGIPRAGQTPRSREAMADEAVLTAKTSPPIARVISKQEVTMQARMTFTRARTIGPILTLILLSSPERGREASAIPGRAAEGPASDHTPLAAHEEAFHAAMPARRPRQPGPILTLILTAEGSQPEDLPEPAVRI